MGSNLPDLLTIEDACRMSGLSRKTVKKIFGDHMTYVPGLTKPRIRREIYETVMGNRQEARTNQN